jgi:hypothetical protein
MIFKFFILVSIFILALPFFVLAATEAESEFIIRVYGGEDLEPPTTPTLLSVVPVASSQINLNWSTSTDNFVLSGYVLSRDGLPIATTTQNSYIDTGLTASTTYSYEVYAFDFYGNISTTSDAVATTTPAIPVVSPTSTTTPGTTYGTQLLRLKQLEIFTEQNSAFFAWETTRAARFALRWGRTEDYDDGYIISQAYLTENKTQITDLEPGTVYLYELIGYSPQGNEVVLERGNFKTKSTSVISAPQNVQGFTALVSIDDVKLNWRMPVGSENLRVRVVRSYLGFPNDPYDGAVIFDGVGTEFNDRDALRNGGPIFYTAFVIGADGAVSSGAVLKVNRVGGEESGQPVEGGVGVEEPLIEIKDFGFSVENIKIRQLDEEFDFKSEKITLAHTEPFVISIPYEALPRHLKSIVVTILDPSDSKRSFSFLLRINKERTAYEAVVAPIGEIGPSRLQLEIFDYERKIIGRYRKQIDFVVLDVVGGEVIFPDKIVAVFKPLLPTIFSILALIILLLIIILSRSKRTEDKR